jgi:hypothetical protein
MNRFFYNLERILVFVHFDSLITFKIFYTFLNIVVFTHLGACAWLFVNKLEPASMLGFFVRSNLTDAPLDVQYVKSLSWAVDTMTGSSFGDVTPQQLPEKYAGCIFMVLGATLYSKLFADFESLMML